MKQKNKKLHKTDMEQGHWVLAKLGKRVLRPGGLELTRLMLDEMDINKADDVVEFAPGLGQTARLTVTHQPHSYTAIELNKAAAERVRKNVSYPHMRVVNADAAQTGLPNGCASKVYGEAMLTMQSAPQKEAIVKEAARLLKPGGLYGIHEIVILHNDTSANVQRTVEKDLAASIKTNVRPLTTDGWRTLLEDNGLEIVAIHQNPMHLLEWRRVVADEGWCGFLRIVTRLLCHPTARKRVLEMRSTFRKHEKNIDAICIIARKKA